MIDLLLFIVSLFLLGWSSILTINASVKLAEIYRLSDLFVGSIILAIGSNLPELVVSISASIDSLSGNDLSGIIVGTNIGSAFTQLGLVLGFMGLITYLTATKKEIYSVGSILLISIIILILVGYDSVIDFIDGLILLFIYAYYLSTFFIGNKKNAIVDNKYSGSHLKTWVLLIIALSMITISAEMTVQNAAKLANTFNVSQSMIALLIIGPGTSLPEFAISLRAMMSKRHSISIGNILGSNIFDTLIPIGVSAMIYPVFIERSFILFDLPALFLLTFICLLFLVKKKGIQKKEAMVILALYIAYLVSKLF